MEAYMWDLKRKRKIKKKIPSTITNHIVEV